MLRRVPAWLLAIGCATATACAYSPEPRPLALGSDEQFTLAPGEKAELTVGGRATTVRLVGVDERPARVLVEVEVPGETYETIALPVAGSEDQMPTEAAAPCLPVGERRIRVTDVTPKPNVPRPQQVYHVTFRAAERC